MAKKNKKIKGTRGYLKKRKKVPGPHGVSSQQSIFQQALALHQAGRLSEAEALYRQILLAEPSHPDALHYLGLLAHQVGKSEIAVELISKALSIKPDYVEAHNSLGVIFNDQGKLDEAVSCFRQALALKPDYAEVHSNLGNALNDQGKLDEAVSCFRQALALKPDYAELHFNLGNVLNDQGKLDDAVASYRHTLTLKPDYVEAHLNLGNAFKDQGNLEGAVACFRQALTLKPDYADAHYNLGNVLRDQGMLVEAVAGYRRALTLKPDYADAHLNLGNALKDQGRLDEAVACYRRVLTLRPDYAQAHSNLLFCLNYRSDITQKEIYNESLQRADRLVADIHTTDTLTYANSLRTDRRLRIGYVSPDFRVHSVAFFIEPVIRAHNKERVEVYCYTNVKKPDKVTQRLQAEADHWLSTVGMEHEAVASRIREDRIDILVDLAGHTSDNSLPVFGQKPAPVQVTWLGYPNTTGLRTMDYRFTDSVADPEGKADTLHSEKLIRLEHGFLCYQPPDCAPEVSSLPCRERGYITFGSFNNLTKVTPEVVKAWARILHAVPDSHLLLKAKQLMDDQIRAHFKKMFAREGITQERLEMHNRLSKQEDHLGLYSRVDIGLDPFPYNGTTTTCEAGWMGVPVVTLLGTRHAGRVGASILHRVGLDELVAPSVEEYIELARSLAGDRKRLHEMRSGLRDRMQKSELMDKELFAETVEKAYRQMWRKYCERALPRQ